MVYREFCANQDTALVKLQKLCDEIPDIATFLKHCEKLMKVKGMPLSSYFLKPMQRLTKYKLLIEKVSYSAFISMRPSSHFVIPVRQRERVRASTLAA